MKKNSGFSLIEILIVIALAGAIILVIANIPLAIRLIGISNNESLAKQIAAQKIEDLRSQTYDNLGNGTSQINDRRLNSLPSSISSVVIEDCSPQICTNGELLIKQITISIGWKDGDKNKNIQIVTLVSKGGLQ